MDQIQRQSMSMVFILMVSAVLCAAATFVAIAVVVGRSDAQVEEGDVAILVTVAGTAISLYPDPDKVIILASEARSTIAPEALDPAQATAAAAAATEAAATAAAQIPATATFPVPTSIPAVSEVIFTTYVVQPGDSLFRITQKQNTSIDLMALHGIDSSDIIVGNTLSLPIANPAFCPGMPAHIVRDQQTVTSIARIYGSSPQSIAAVNNLDASYHIKTTQVLCIP